MKVLLVNPGVSQCECIVGNYAPLMTPVLPHGVAYIASALREDGHIVQVEDQFASHLSHFEISQKVIKDKIDIVGISTLTALQSETKILIKLIKHRSPAVKIILGNIHASYFGEQCLKECGADIIVHGEGEETIRETLSVLIHGGNLASVKGITFLQDTNYITTTLRPPLQNLDRLPFPAWDLFDLSKYPSPPFLKPANPIVPIIITRGCPYHCKFCSQKYIFPGKVRIRNISNVVDEIEWIYKKFHVTHFGLNDAIFPYNTEQAYQFSEELIRRGLNKKIIWFTEMRVDHVSSSMIKIMKKSGLYLVMLGIESCNDEILHKSGKTQNFKEIKLAVNTLHAEGVLTFGLFIIGLPGETMTSALKTINKARALPLTFAKFNRAVPYPGSELFKSWQSENNIKPPFLWEKFSAWAPIKKSEDILYLPEGLSAQDLKYLQTYAVQQFYLKPSRIYFLLSNRMLSIKHLFHGLKIILSGINERLKQLNTT